MITSDEKTTIIDAMGAEWFATKFALVAMLLTGEACRSYVREMVEGCKEVLQLDAISRA